MAERWASFDCYGTLIDWQTGLRDAYATVWQDLDPDRALALHHVVEPRVQEGYPELPYRQVLARCLAAVAAIEGSKVARGSEGSLADSLPSWPPFREVPSALARLRRSGWRLAILSNTDADLLAASVDALGVEIDLAVTAAEAGSYKPAAGHWQRFAAESGVEPGHHVHVAASLFHDIEPCARLEIPAVWINRLAEVSPLPRAAELADLVDLPGTLERVVGALEGSR